MNEKVNYSKDLKPYEKVIFEVDLTVCGIEMFESDDSNFKFDQMANKADLLADFKTKETGDTLTVYLNNESGKSIVSGTQNSKATLVIPKGILVELNISVGVGDVTLDIDNISVSKIDLDMNVGAVTLKSTTNQDSLESIVVNNDVGEVDVILSASYDKKLNIEATTNIGNIDYKFAGTYKEGISADLKSDVGGIKIFIPKNTPAKIVTNGKDFTSDVKIKGLEYEKDGDTYLIGTKSGNLKRLDFDIESNVGDLEIGLSN